MAVLSEWWSSGERKIIDVMEERRSRARCRRDIVYEYGS